MGGINSALFYVRYPRRLESIQKNAKENQF